MTTLNNSTSTPTITNIDAAQAALPDGYTVKGLAPNYAVLGNDGKFIGTFRSLGGAVKAAHQHHNGLMVNPPNPKGGRLAWFVASGNGGTLKCKTLAGLGREMAAADAEVWEAEMGPGVRYDGSDWDREAFRSWRLADAMRRDLSDERIGRAWEAYLIALPEAIDRRCAAKA